jgi:uncharacterized NAD(P)/FAD-binding protein YdhS
VTGGADRFSVAVIGAGFTGTMVAVHLLRDPGLRDARLAILERTGRFTAGVAYGTDYECHTLNVPAARMSAFADDADDFLTFATSRNPGVTGGSFVPRSLYGAYLGHLLDAAEARSSSSLRRIAGQATSVEAQPDGSTRVGIEGADPIFADRVVLAIGNFPPADPSISDPAFYSDPRYARDPWAADALDADPDRPVLLVGTGLTMLDIALALRDRGHRAVIHAVSRHGLLPQPHRAAAVPPPHYPRPAGLDGWPRTAAGLLRMLRAEVDAAANAGIDWREVHTSLRADTPALWMSLSQTEKERFLRHARPYWETHRHRAAPQTAAAIRELLADGRLQVTAARLLGFEPCDDDVDALLRHRGETETSTVRIAKVVNCTGPDTDLRRVAEPLVQQLLRTGAATADPLGLGLRSDAHGGLIDTEGQVSERLFLVGPLRKGLLWENTAVPELRVEAEQMARQLGRLTPR